VEIENKNLEKDKDCSEIVRLMRMKKEEMDKNLSQPIKGKILKRRCYKAYKWISFRYSTVKTLIKLAFGEWTVAKKKGEMFE
jgi:hypothetical protein